MRRPGLNRQLHVRVASAQHRRKTGGFLFPPPFLARLFKVPMASHRAQSPLAVELLLEPPQGLFHGLAFLQFYLGQNTFTSSPATWNPQAQRAGAPSSVRPNSLRLARGLSTGKKRPKSADKDAPPLVGVISVQQRRPAAGQRAIWWSADGTNCSPRRKIQALFPPVTTPPPRPGSVTGRLGVVWRIRSRY